MNQEALNCTDDFSNLRLLIEFVDLVSRAFFKMPVFLNAKFLVRNKN